MKYLFLSLLFVFTGPMAIGQEQNGLLQGSVSYVTSQSVYVRFPSMERINQGDTLLVKQGNRYLPGLQIRNKSSISCVCTPLPGTTYTVADPVFARLVPQANSEATTEEPGSSNSPAALMVNQPTENVNAADSGTEKRDVKDPFKQKISGRISVSSYSDLFSSQMSPRQRMRYTFSMHAGHIGGSELSLESYLSFSHTNTNWEEIRKNVFNGLKIYNLAATYDFSESMQMVVGRKINPALSSVGAIDGIQLSKKYGALTLGAIAGSRPDYQDYSINPDLFQFGAYAGHELKRDRGYFQNSLAFIEQTNHFKTDRRFLYLQHSSMMMRKLNLFGSAEIDLFKKVNNASASTFDLNNIYLSLMYRFIRQISLGVSYSSRRQIIYYETYKDFVERLLESEALQGWQLRLNTRPLKHLIIGIRGGYRYRKEDPLPSKHVYGYASWRALPSLNTAITLSNTWLETSYLKGNVYSAGLSGDIIPGKLSAGVKYRYVDYHYLASEIDLVQNVIETDLTWMLAKKLSMSAFYEGTFESVLNHHRIYLNLTKRF